MNKLRFLAVIPFLYSYAFSQTCTVTGTSPLNWPTNGSGISCAEGGNAVGKTTVVIPAGFAVNLDGNGDTWAGTTIEVYGTLNVTANPIFNTSIRIKNGGLMNISGKLSLGSSSGCGYTLVIETGATVTVGDNGADRLSICGKDIIQGAGCEDCGGTYSAQCPLVGNNPKPYCEPPGGFTGPTGYDDDGYNNTLPIELLYFRAEERDAMVELTWATTMEENFSRFVVERSGDGTGFEAVGEVAGKGLNLYDIQSEYGFDDPVPLSGYNYYRLKAVDLDESFEYSAVRAVRVEATKDVAAYPNPGSGEAMTFRTNFAPSEFDRMILTDLRGQEVLSRPVSEMINGITFTERLDPGIYVLKYVSPDFELVRRVVVKH